MHWLYRRRDLKSSPFGLAAFTDANYRHPQDPRKREGGADWILSPLNASFYFFRYQDKGNRESFSLENETVINRISEWFDIVKESSILPKARAED